MPRRSSQRPACLVITPQRWHPTTALRPCRFILTTVRRRFMPGPTRSSAISLPRQCSACDQNGLAHDTEFIVAIQPFPAPFSPCWTDPVILTDGHILGRNEGKGVYGDRVDDRRGAGEACGTRS